MNNKQLRRIISSVLLALILASSLDMRVFAAEGASGVENVEIQEQLDSSDEVLENENSNQIEVQDETVVLEENEVVNETDVVGTEEIEEDNSPVEDADVTEVTEPVDNVETVETNEIVENIETEETQDEMTYEIYEEVEPEIVCDSADSEINLYDYIDSKVENDLHPVFYASSMSGSKLTGVNKKMYEKVKDLAIRVAAGEESSTVASLNADELGIDPNGYTAEQLGISTIANEGIVTEEAEEALKAYIGLDDYDILAIMGAVRRDCPYEAYWIGLSYANNGYRYRAIYKDGEWRIYLKLEPEGFCLYVTPSEDFKGAVAYTVNSNNIQLVNTAVENIKQVVSNASSMGDREKLEYYCKWICDNNEYNLDAVKEPPGTYGHPWQLIYVFDGNASTKTVCEGYSKAFAYLCEKTNFTNSAINVYTVDGNAGKTGDLGAHMWNIIHWSDDINYLADITFTDTANYSYDTATKKFFMLAPVSGNVNAGYDFTVGGQGYTYAYSDSTKKDYTTEQITLGSVDESILTDINIKYDSNVKTGENVEFILSNIGGSADCVYKIDRVMFGATDYNKSEYAIYAERHSFSFVFNNPGTYELIFWAKDSDGTEIRKDLTVQVRKQVHPDGLNQLSDGQWWYFIDDVIQSNYTGLVDKDGVSYYVQKGQLITGVNGIVSIGGTKYYLKDSAVQTSYTGIVSYEGTDYYVQKGIFKTGVNGLTNVGGTYYYLSNSTVRKDYTGLVKLGNSWYYVQNGVLVWGVNTLVNYNGTWYYVNNSTVDYGYTGIFNYGGTDYYLQKGIIEWGVNGLTNVGSTWYYLSNSAVKKDYTGLVQLGSNWYYVQSGVLKWGVRTLVQYGGTWYYVNNSTLDWNYTGIFNYGGTDYYIQKGQIKWGVNGLTNVGGTWYNLSNSAVNKSYTGLVQYNGSWFYVKNGVLDWNYTGVTEYGGTKYYVQKGQLKWGVNGLTNAGGTWYYLSNSAVNKGYTGLVSYNGSWFYVQKGQLVWGVRTLVQYQGTWYYVNNSTLDWNFTGIVNYGGTDYYVQKGVLKWGVNGLTNVGGTWYYLGNSAVKSNYTGLVQLGNSWYYVQKGVLKWGERTLVNYGGTWYYVNNSTLDWNFTGIVNYGGTEYYIQKGVLKWGYNGKVNYNGKTYTLSNSIVKK